VLLIWTDVGSHKGPESWHPEGVPWSLAIWVHQLISLIDIRT
jgi:hypothetical protein